jgi:hypothetical protein
MTWLCSSAAVPGPGNGPTFGPREGSRLYLIGHWRAEIVAAEPGMGKTALLDYATGEASGMRVLSAAAVASECELPFACLHRLVSRVAGSVREIPEVQREALLSALALGRRRAQTIVSFCTWRC